MSASHFPTCPAFHDDAATCACSRDYSGSHPEMPAVHDPEQPAIAIAETQPTAAAVALGILTDDALRDMIQKLREANAALHDQQNSIAMVMLMLEDELVTRQGAEADAAGKPAQSDEPFI